MKFIFKSIGDIAASLDADAARERDLSSTKGITAKKAERHCAAAFAYEQAAFRVRNAEFADISDDAK